MILEKRIEGTRLATIDEFVMACTLLGDASTIDLHGNPAVNDDWLDRLAALPLHPEKVILSGTRVSDWGLARLAQMQPRHLTAIYVAETQVTVAGLGHLLVFPDLKTVFATGNNIPADAPTVTALRAHTEGHFGGARPGENEGLVLDWSHDHPLSAMR